MKKILLILTMLLLFAVQAWGADWFVRPSGGTYGDENGTSYENAWDGFSNITWGEGGVVAGDTLYLDGVYREKLTVGASGTSGNPITITSYNDMATIKSSDLYSDWWEHSEIVNGGFEALISNSDYFYPNWTILGTVSRSTDDKSDGSYSAKGVSTASKYNTYLRQNQGISASTQYYFSFDTKAAIGQTILLQVQDVSTGTTYYLQGDSSFTTDGCFFEYENTAWETHEIVFTTRADATDLRFYIFFEGNELTGYVDNVYLIEGDSHLAERVWSGYISGSLEQFDAVSGSSRLNKVTFDSVGDYPVPGDGLIDGYFYSLVNAPYPFYLRNDAGNPGEIEIGVRNNCVYSTGKSYITISNLLLYAPSGAASGEDARAIIFTGTGTDITIDNLFVRYSSGTAILLDTNIDDSVVKNCEISRGGSNGIQINGDNCTADNNSIHNNGQAIGDSTSHDYCAVCLTAASNIEITDNHIYSNGPKDKDADFDISAATCSGNIVITNNYLRDCYQGGIQVAEGTPSTTINGNIISGFGTSTAETNSSFGKWSGIRIGGGTGATMTATVANNTIINGDGLENDAGIVIGATAADTITDVIFENNIFYNNSVPDFISYSSATVTGDFDYNSYYKTDFTGNWVFGGSSYNSIAAWRTGISDEAHSIITNPLLVQIWKLKEDSPAIGEGVQVTGVNDGGELDIAGNAAKNPPNIGAYYGYGMVGGGGGNNMRIGGSGISGGFNIGGSGISFHSSGWREGLAPPSPNVTMNGEAVTMDGESVTMGAS